MLHLASCGSALHSKIRYSLVATAWITLELEQYILQDIRTNTMGVMMVYIYMAQEVVQTTQTV